MTTDGAAVGTFNDVELGRKLTRPITQINQYIIAFYKNISKRIDITINYDNTEEVVK